MHVSRTEADIAKTISRMAHRRSAWEIFTDFVEVSAITISNAVDWSQPQRDTREARYLQIVKNYDAAELQQFANMLGSLVMQLEEKVSDVLGRAFHDLELHNKYTGQFFSPYPICQMMAAMTANSRDELQAIINARGFITAQEPCCGSGAMAIALAQHLKAEGINYQNHLHVTAIDIDLKCVHMAYMQLSFLHVPAVVIHGNSLSLEEHSHWYTPAHIMGGWNYRLSHPRQINAPEAATAPPALTIDQIIPYFDVRLAGMNNTGATK